MKPIILIFTLLMAFLITSQALAQPSSNGWAPNSQFSHWQPLPLQATQRQLTSTDAVSTTRAVTKIRRFSTDTVQLRTLLLKAVENTPQQGIVITLPMPDGSFADFSLTHAAVMAPELAKKFPTIKTFKGYQVNNPENSGRFDVTSHGFHGMFLFNGDMAFIEPEHNESHYLSYFQRDHMLTNAAVFNKRLPKVIKSDVVNSVNLGINKLAAKQDTTKGSQTSTSAIKTYRLAISAAGEYSVFHSNGTPNKTDVLSELVTLVNRLNDVYARDVAIEFELVANNDALIHLDASTDPFNNDDLDGDINTGIIDGLIGSDSYDIGHVVNTNGGGLAVLGAACLSLYKGDGITGSPSPINDAFYIDYVAHEIGHQFGANHTFNGIEEACDGNRVASAAYEPGSASTIMGYAGICGSQNIQFNSDPYFHAKSIEQITDYAHSGQGSTCGVESSVINNLPVVDAGADFTIPAQTPFMLTGNAIDDDLGSTLSYDWQQFDLGTESSSVIEQIDDGTRPLFRVWNPVATPSRTFPKMADVLAGRLTLGETYPTTNREITMRLLVRDGQGGVGIDDTKITVVDTGEAFMVNAPNSGDTWLSNEETVTWQTAGTELAPILCDAVDINLSLDGGSTFALNLATAVTNNGSAKVKMNQVTSTQGRIKVSCTDNIFFAVNSGNFTLDTSLPPPVITGQVSLSVEEGSAIELNASMFTYSDTVGESLLIADGDNYSVATNTVTPISGFTGELSIGITAVAQGISSDPFIATITVTAKPVVVPPPISTPPPVKSSSGGSIYWLLLLLLYKRVYLSRTYNK